MKLGQEAPCSPAPGALSQAQKDRAQKITPADPTQPPSSSREFSQPVRAVTAQASAVLHRAVPTVPRSERGQRGRPRRGPPGRLRRPPSRAFCRFCWEIAFCGPRARRVCMARGPFDVGPCPTHPGVSAGRVGRVAGCAGARRAAGGGLKIVICHDICHDSCTQPRGRVTSVKMAVRGSFQPPQPIFGLANELKEIEGLLSFDTQFEHCTVIVWSYTVTLIQILWDT